MSPAVLRPLDGLAEPSLDGSEVVVAEVTDARLQRQAGTLQRVGGRVSVEGGVEVAGRRAPRGDGERLLARPQTGGGEAAAIDVAAAAAQVVGDLDGAARVLAVARLEVVGERQVEALAVTPARFVVQQLTHERVVERVSLAVVTQETGNFRLGEEIVEVGRGDRLEVGDERAVAQEGGRRQHRPARPPDDVEPAAQLTVETARDELVDGADQLAVTHDQTADVELPGDHRAHEEGIAGGRLGDLRQQATRRARRGERGDQLVELELGHPAEPHRLHGALALQPLDGAGDVALGRTQRDDEEDCRRRQRAGVEGRGDELLEQLSGVRVGPVEVLEQEHDRSTAGGDDCGAAGGHEWFRRARFDGSEWVE